jgi:cellulose synthase/poly-beta-1,6-N-acetylglucosamine synthase-like glycosyltransferase
MAFGRIPATLEKGEVGRDWRRTAPKFCIYSAVRQLCRRLDSFAPQWFTGIERRREERPPLAELLSILLTLAALVLFCLVIVLAVEIVAGLLTGPGGFDRDEPASGATLRPSVAVIVPAHNESAGILPTLADIRAQLTGRDRLIVVADNCSDDTAAVAADAGAEVLVRNEPDKIGKGYALAWGRDHLRSRPPEIVVTIDADCRLGEGTLDRLAATSAMTGRPAQGLYLMRAPAGSPPVMRVAEFAWRIKNWARPLGLRALGLPCQLTGSGMAFPWAVIGSAELASGEIVEDMKLGLDLARDGAAPIFCPSAVVTSYFPASPLGAETQRHRWEQGHLGTMFRQVPRLLFVGITRRIVHLSALALDLALPPLALFLTLILMIFVLSLLATMLGLTALPLLITSLSLLLSIVSFFAAWHRYGRNILSARDLIQITNYTFTKVPMYLRMLLQRSQMGWIRTDRTTR